MSSSASVSESATASESAPAGEGQRGGTLNYLVPIEAPTMDPCGWNYSGQGTNGLRAVGIYDSLVRYNLTTKVYDFHMAESLEPSADFATWTLKLKPGIMFSDGTPLDAEAVKYNWERLVNPDLTCTMAGNASEIASMTVVDDVTLEITLVVPSATFIETVASRIGNVIGSPTAFETLGADFGTAPVGAGPFTLDEWVKDDRMVLVRNDGYYRASEGLPYLDSIVIRPLLDGDQRVSAFENGEVDLSMEQVGPTIKRLEDGGFDVIKQYLQGAENMLFNTTVAPFDDVRARQAFALSVDPAQLNDVVYEGTLEPAQGFIYPDSAYYNADITRPTPDCAAAGELWAELAAENGGPVEFAIGVFSINQPPQAEFMQAAISQCGGENVNVTVDVAEASAAVERIYAKNYQVHGWGIQFVNRPESILGQLRCENPRNATGFCNADFDALLDQSAGTLDTAALTDLYGQAEQILTDEMPVFFYKRTLVAAASQPTVHGVSIFEDGIIPLESVWLES